MTNDVTKSDNKFPNKASKIKKSYNELLVESARLYPKVDQRLLLDILRFETTYKDWEGSVMLKIVYPAEGVDLQKNGSMHVTNVLQVLRKKEHFV